MLLLSPFKLATTSPLHVYSPNPFKPLCSLSLSKMTVSICSTDSSEEESSLGGWAFRGTMGCAEQLSLHIIL
jgi:hypothetical protein